MSIHQALCRGVPHQPTIATKEVIEAHGQGKRVQVSVDGGQHWADIQHPSFDPRFAWRVHPQDKAKPERQRELIQIGPLDV